MKSLEKQQQMKGAAALWGRGCWLALALLMGGPLALHATTIHVERDGSGDYDALQPAIDAAAPGDTLLIGPGRYDQYVQYVSSPYDTLDAIARAGTPNLTFRGTSRDGVIVGPEVRPVSTAYRGSTCFFFDPTTGVRLESMTIENAQAGINSNAELYLRDILLRGHEELGVGNLSQYPLIIKNCTVEDSCVGLILRAGDVGTEVEQVTFIANADKGISAALGADFEVRDCSFSPPSSGAVAFGILLDRSSKAHVATCHFSSGVGLVGISLNGYSNAVVDSCQFGTGRANIAVGNVSNVVGSGNIFGGGALGTMYFADRSTAELAGNDILHTSGPSVLINSFYSVAGPGPIDLRDNYWGSDSADSISAWIYDAQDDPNIAPTVLFEPFRTQSIPVGELSTGMLKSRYLGAH